MLRSFSHSILPKFLVLGGVVLAAWLYLPSHSVIENSKESKNTDASLVQKVEFVPASEILGLQQKTRVIASSIVSKEGDPCKVVDVTRDSVHVGWYPPGYYLKETMLSCENGGKKYLLDNKGVYTKNGKLVSAKREKIYFRDFPSPQEGYCSVYLNKREPSKKIKNIEYVTSVYSCRKNGKDIWRQISAVYKDNKPIHLEEGPHLPLNLKGAKHG
jgi:hypothetical protein